MANLNPDQIRRLARLGAVARLEQLREEEAGIRAEFPELFGQGRDGGSSGGRGRRARGAAASGGDAGAAGAATAAGSRRRRTRMSAAARKAVSVRMRKYWAERRKAAGK